MKMQAVPGEWGFSPGRWFSSGGQRLSAQRLITARTGPQSGLMSAKTSAQSRAGRCLMLLRCIRKAEAPLSSWRSKQPRWWWRLLCCAMVRKALQWHLLLIQSCWKPTAASRLGLLLPEKKPSSTPQCLSHVSFVMWEEQQSCRVDWTLYVMCCLKVMIGALESGGDIVSVSCCDNEIFILKGDRDVIRLSNSPEGFTNCGYCSTLPIPFPFSNCNYHSTSGIGCT